MNPSGALTLVVVVWLAALGSLIFYRLFTGGISVDGLFRSGSNQFSPERVQLLAVTVGSALAYATNSLSKGRLVDFQDPSDGALLLLLFGSHAVYLTGKAIRH